MDVSQVMSQLGGRRMRAVLSLPQCSASQLDQGRRAQDKTSGKIWKDEGFSCLMHVELLFLPEHGRVAQWRKGDIQEKEEKETEEVRRHRWDQHVQSG